MGTRHWPEDADEEVERLEAENALLRDKQDGIGALWKDTSWRK